MNEYAYLNLRHGIILCETRRMKYIIHTVSRSCLPSPGISTSARRISQPTPRNTCLHGARRRSRRRGCADVWLKSLSSPVLVRRAALDFAYRWKKVASRMVIQSLSPRSKSMSDVDSSNSLPGFGHRGKGGVFCATGRLR